jgi:hypothetical protein
MIECNLHLNECYMPLDECKWPLAECTPTSCVSMFHPRRAFWPPARAQQPTTDVGGLTNGEFGAATTAAAAPSGAVSLLPEVSL